MDIVRLETSPCSELLLLEVGEDNVSAYVHLADG